MCCQRSPELRVGHHRGVSNAVDRLQAVAHPNGVDAPPTSGCPDPGVDLEVQVSVGVACAGGEVTHDGCLDLFDWHLHLPTTRSNPGSRVRGEPADDLLGDRHLSCVVGRRDLGVQRRRERPGLRPVDSDLDESHRLVIGPESALRCTGLDVEPGDPALVGLSVHVVPVFDAVGGSDDPDRNAAALGEVVVVGTGSVGLHVVARGRRRSPVDLYAAVHPKSPLLTTVNNHETPGQGVRGRPSRYRIS